MSRKYLAVLAIAAALILLIGITIRPEETTVMVAPSADESPLRQLSRDAALRDQTALIEDRVQNIARNLISLPDGRSALRWRRGIALTTADTMLVQQILVWDTIPPADTVTTDRRIRWLVAAARDAQDSVLSVAGISGGTSTTMCYGAPYREVVLSQSIPPALAGAGVFTMGGERLGLVVKCDGRLVVLPVAEVDRYLAGGTDTIRATPAESAAVKTGAPSKKAAGTKKSGAGAPR
jgi:hypothetical protein